MFDLTKLSHDQLYIHRPADVTATITYMGSTYSIPDDGRIYIPILINLGLTCTADVGVRKAGIKIASQNQASRFILNDDTGVIASSNTNICYGLFCSTVTTGAFKSFALPYYPLKYPDNIVIAVTATYAGDVLAVMRLDFIRSFGSSKSYGKVSDAY